MLTTFAVTRLLPVRDPIEVRQGETLDALVVVLTAPDGTPYDLTGCSGRAAVRTGPLSSTAVLELTTANGGMVLGDPEGSVRLVASAAVTAVLAAAVLTYDVFVRFADGREVPVGDGVFRVVGTDTRYP